MPEFANPFIGKAPDRKLTAEELVRAIRLDLAAEEEAIHQYMSQADVADHPLARKVLIEIANEERQHAGEFLRLLQILTGDEDKWLADGAAEVNDLATEEEAPEQEKTEASDGEAPSIGSLKE
jgi:rubrerythrin